MRGKQEVDIDDARIFGNLEYPMHAWKARRTALYDKLNSIILALLVTNRSKLYRVCCLFVLSVSLIFPDQ